MGYGVGQSGVNVVCWREVSMRVGGMVLGVGGRVRDRVARGRSGRRCWVEDNRRRGGEEEGGALATPSSARILLLL